MRTVAKPRATRGDKQTGLWMSMVPVGMLRWELKGCLAPHCQVHGELGKAGEVQDSGVERPPNSGCGATAISGLCDFSLEVANSSMKMPRFQGPGDPGQIGSRNYMCRPGCSGYDRG